MRCGALERHRFAWLYFRRCTDLWDGRPKRFLHVAPEWPFQAPLREALGEGYVTADLMDPRVDLRLDLSDTALPDASFDAVYCSHVLEHIPDDRAAMREVHRILRPGGWAIFLVPVGDAPTDEDPSISDPDERRRRFGQEDHVRLYGADFAERLEEAGFEVRAVRPLDAFTADEVGEAGLFDPWPLFHCMKHPRKGGVTRFL